tara:strand:+ start:247 stop:477 length:231 start_codon:yes stop_codon:yes gene_type:complete
MDELIKYSEEIMTHMDNGDLMSCYSLFESNIRGLLDDLDPNDGLVKLWLTQKDHVDDEDWAAVMENVETIREYLNA